MLTSCDIEALAIQNIRLGGFSVVSVASTQASVAWLIKRNAIPIVIYNVLAENHFDICAIVNGRRFCENDCGLGTTTPPACSSDSIALIEID